MLDISNKLHAMVDEFVSNLSSECGSLANNVSAHRNLYVPHDTGPEVATAPRLSNRTTSEVLNGLRRPCGNQAMDNAGREGRLHMEHAQSTPQGGNTRIMDGVRPSRQTKELKTRSASLERIDHKNDGRSVDIIIDNNGPRNGLKHGRSTHDGASKGKFVHTVEVLSSDHSSDVSTRPSQKLSKDMRRKHNSKRIRKSSLRGRTTRMDIHSPSTSPGRSHSMDYSYEEDTNSLGTKNPHAATTFPKLRWPKDVEELHASGNNDVHTHKECHKQNETHEGDEDISRQLSDSYNSEDLGHNAAATETDGEELPVLPKVPVKRKILSERREGERRNQRGTPKSGSPATKKQRTPQIDASVITKLEFGPRPQNSVSIPTMLL